MSAANIQSYMTNLALSLVRGADMPDLWLMGATYYRMYVESLMAIQRISSSGDSTAGAGFPTLKFYGGGMATDVVLGGGINSVINTAGQGYSTATTGGETAALAYLINTKYLNYRPHSQRNFVPIGGERQAVNQDAIVKLIGWAGNITCSGDRYHGVLSA